MAAKAKPRSGVTVVALTLASVLAVLAGCTSSGIQGTPYGEEIKATKKKKSPEKTDTQPTDPDDDEDPAPTQKPTTTMAADAGTDSATLNNQNCAAQKGLPCEDCCFNKLPGGPALLAQMDSMFAQCVQQEQCGNNTSCLDFCNGMAADQTCASQTALCNQLDACINQNACYQ